MASGIVEVFAKAGYDVTFVGRGQDKIDGVIAAITKSLDKAIARGKLDEDAKAAVLGRLTGSTEREALADADIIVEAIAEDLAIKLELFGDLDRIAKPGAILATTTSSLSINACAAATKRPQDVIGMHFFNPAAVMKLVEVVTADETSVEVDETVRALCWPPASTRCPAATARASSSMRCCSPTSTTLSSCTRPTAVRWRRSMRP